jgi:hypothetical protein
VRQDKGTEDHDERIRQAAQPADVVKLLQSVQGVIMDNLPEKKTTYPVNPIQNILMGMPGLPEIIQNAVPAPLPPLEYDTTPWGMIGANWKRKQIEKATERERNIAQNARDAALAKLEATHAIITFSSRVTDTLRGYEHTQNMRRYEEREAEEKIKLLELEGKKMEAETTKLGYEVAVLANEVKLGQIRAQIEEKHLNDVLNGVESYA